ncbi:hypothetical protein [Metamycoplasma buccale]|uniref:hypothetical protein n=1 Tax=Metamycoplasma buccale TaxID=55602 RepID=UPI00398F4BF0
MNNIENLKNKIKFLKLENRDLKLKVKSYEDAFERLKDIQDDLYSSTFELESKIDKMIDILDDEVYDGYNGY